MRLVLSFLMVMFAFVSTFAQQVPKEPKAANPNYDAEMAKRLGGDENGMRQYVLAILKTGPNDGKYAGEERAKMFAGHMASIERWAGEGKLAVAGPFMKNDKTYRGLYIFAVTKIEEAQAIAEQDPAIKNGIFVVDYTPWFGSASLMATPELHKKLHKFKQ